VGRGLIHFFVEGESECTGERGRGQFSIFGAVEENVAADFRGWKRIEIFFKDVRLSRAEGAGSF
jgi:hypothetical protein